MQTEIEKMSDEKLVKELELQNIDYAMEYDKEEMEKIDKNCNNIKAELLKRLNWKERLIKKIEASKITRENKTIGDQVHNICIIGIINLIRNFK